MIKDIILIRRIQSCESFVEKAHVNRIELIAYCFRSANYVASLNESSFYVGKKIRNRANKLLALYYAFIPRSDWLYLSRDRLIVFACFIFRCVPDNQRSFALGIQFLIMRAISFLPGPILLGAILDSYCISWGYNKCGEKTSCHDYDIDGMSMSLVVFAVAVSGKNIFFLNCNSYFDKIICGNFASKCLDSQNNNSEKDQVQ